MVRNVTYGFGLILWTGKPTRRWEDNIKMDLKEIRYEDVESIHLVQDKDR
jgi:hypothetical protein